MRPRVPPDLEVPLQEVELYLRAAEGAAADRVHRLEGAVADLEDLLRLLLRSSAPPEEIQADEKSSSSCHEETEGAGGEDIGADDDEMGELGRRIEEALGSARAVRGYADSPRSRAAAGGGGGNSPYLASSSSTPVSPLVTPPLPRKPPVPDRRGVVRRAPTCASRGSRTSTMRHRRVSTYPLSTPVHNHHHTTNHQQQVQVQRPHTDSHTRGSSLSSAGRHWKKTVSAPEGGGRTSHIMDNAGGAGGAGGGGGSGGRAKKMLDTEGDCADGPSLEVVCERVQKLREGEKQLKAAVKEAREKLSVCEDLGHAQSFARGLLHKLQTEQTEQHDVYGCTSDDDDDDGASSDLYDRLLASAMASSSSSASPSTTSSSSSSAAAARRSHEQAHACNTDLEPGSQEEGPIWASPLCEEVLEAGVGKRLLPSLVKAFRRQAEAATSSSFACAFPPPPTSMPRGPQSSSMQHRGDGDVCADSSQVKQNDEWTGLLRVYQMAHTMLLAGRSSGS